jgi:hypothetical protein
VLQHGTHCGFRGVVAGAVEEREREGDRDRIEDVQVDRHGLA